MNEETLLEQMTRVRPEMLNENALKLFNKIMEVIDERDELQQENQRLKESVDGLCQENTELKEQIKIYEDPDDLFLMFMWCDEKAKDKIKELQQRIEKAIEIIESYNLGKYDYSIPPIGIIELLETLKGEEK